MKTCDLFTLVVLALLAYRPDHAALILVCAVLCAAAGSLLYGLLLPLLLGRPTERDIF